MKHIFLSLLSLLGLMGCNSSLKVMEASSQSWVGGAPGSGSGVSYRIQMTKPKGLEIKIVRVWMGNAKGGDFYDFAVTEKGSGGSNNNHILPEEILEFEVSWKKYIRGMNTPKNRNNQPAPFAISDSVELAAIIEWQHTDEKSGHLIITDFTEKSKNIFQ